MPTYWLPRNTLFSGAGNGQKMIHDLLKQYHNPTASDQGPMESFIVDRVPQILPQTLYLMISSHNRLFSRNLNVLVFPYTLNPDILFFCHYYLVLRDRTQNLCICIKNKWLYKKSLVSQFWLSRIQGSNRSCSLIWKNFSMRMHKSQQIKDALSRY